MKRCQITSFVGSLALATAALAIGAQAFAATIAPINPAGDFFTNPGTQAGPQVDLTEPLNAAGWSYTNVRNGGTIGINNTYSHAGSATVELSGIYGPSGISSKADIEYTPAGGLGTLANLTALSYDWYTASTSDVHQVPILRLYVQDPTNSANRGYLVFEPTYNDHPSPGTLTNQWVSENVFGLDGHVWATGSLASLAGVNTAASPSSSTLEDWMNAYGTYNVLTLNAGFGSGWGPFSGAVDNLSIGFGGVTTAFTFSTTPEPDALILLSVAAAGLAVCAGRVRRQKRQRLASADC